MRLALGEVRPDEDHRRTRCGGEDDEAGDIGVDLARRQVGPEQIADEQPAERCHREGLDSPVDEERDADAAQMLLDLAEGGEVDTNQQRHDHEPDQRRAMQLCLGGLCRVQRTYELPTEIDSIQTIITQWSMN